MIVLMIDDIHEDGVIARDYYVQNMRFVTIYPICGDGGSVNFRNYKANRFGYFVSQTVNTD